MIGEAEQAVKAVDEVYNPFDFIDDLFRQHEEVGVILGKGAHPHQAVQHPGKLMTVHQTHFAQAQGQFLVAVQILLVCQKPARAVHGLDRIVFIIDLGEIHVLFIMIPVPGAVPQFFIQDYRGANLLVAGQGVFLTPEVFEFIANYHALGQKQGKTGSFIHCNEQAQLPPQFAVVALFGLFQLVQVIIQLCFLGERSGVDTLQHGIILTAAPVGPGHAHQFDRFDLAG